MADANTVAVRLLGSPKSHSYNVGSKEKPDWKVGGSVIDVSPEVAELYVEKNRIAVYVDLSKQAEVAALPTEQILQSGNVTFDQTLTPAEQNTTTAEETNETQNE